MYANHIFQLGYEALMLILVLSGPPILISVGVGLFVAIFQAATQIQEQTLSTTVKLLAVILSLMVLGGWLGAEILEYAQRIFANFAKWSR